MRLLPVLLAAALVSSAAAQLTARERQGVRDALYVGNMTPSDLEFERKLFSDPYRLPLVNLAIDRPLEAADRLMGLHASATGPLASVLQTALSEALWGPKITASPPAEGASFSAPVPEPLRRPVGLLVAAIAEANTSIRTATARLTPDERRMVIESLPRWANEEPSIEFDFAKTPRAPLPDLLAALAKVDLDAIRVAGVRLALRVQAELPALRALARTTPVPAPVRFWASGVTVEIGGQGADVHATKDTNLTIDLGGNDTYTGRYGAGIGYASVLIDVGGNDDYQTPDASIGAGLLGIGLAYDLGGDDAFRGRSISLGAGLAGVGALFKDGGDDLYSGRSLTQGFGEFGIGVLVDSGGSDRYDAKFNGQGAARTQGVGWLVDQGGNDVYRAGGLIVNSPLFARASYSNAQGYASGYREDTGGISGGVGLLTDLSGDDVYVGETYCQAASYWFSLGSLYDGAGDDTYTAYHYAQASAMHMTGAYLFDLEGDDGYVVKVGAAHAIGHDYGVGFLLDRAGDDVYAARDSRPGIGNANGVGIFVDAAGEDRYFGPPGVGNPGRGSGSVGVFADLGGPDRFAEGLEPGQARADGTWGVALAVGGTASGIASPPASPTAPTPGSAPLAPPDELAAIYAKATQWGVGTAQDEVHTNVARLIAMGRPALDWMLNERLAGADRLQLRAFVAVVNALGAEGRAALAPRIESTNDDVARNALRIAIDTRATEAAGAIAGALGRPTLRRLAAQAAGAAKATEAVPALMELTASSDRILALNALLALRDIGDERANSTAQALLVSPDLPIRKAAISLLAKSPRPGLLAAEAMIAAADERSRRTGIELLAALGTPEALALLPPFLEGGTPGTRIQAMLALNGRFPPEARSRLAALRQDPNPLVRAVAARIDPGR